MEQVGTKASRGFGRAEMEQVRAAFPDHVAEWVSLRGDEDVDRLPEAEVLIIRGAFPSDALRDQLLRPEAEGGVDWDTKARYNLLFCAQTEPKVAPNYEAKQGTKYSLAALPELAQIHARLVAASPLSELIVEGNYYYDVERCFIGAHGDTERRVVIGLRLGDDFPLHYQWFQHHAPIRPVQTLALHHGDLYVMSEKAVGCDWKLSTIPTLRHGAGPLSRFHPQKKTCAKRRGVGNA
jgi:hypothetical protein